MRSIQMVEAGGAVGKGVGGGVGVAVGGRGVGPELQELQITGQASFTPS